MTTILFCIAIAFWSATHAGDGSKIAEKGKEEPDFNNSFEFFKKQNRLLSQEGVTFCLRNKRPDKALELLEPHVRKSYPPALFQAATIYTEGENGVKQDFKTASFLFSKVFMSRNNVHRRKAAEYVLEIPCFMPIKESDRTIEEAKKILRGQRWKHACVEKYHTETEELRDWINGKKAVSNNELERKLFFYKRFKEINPNLYISKLCDMHMANILGFYENPNENQIAQMKTHIATFQENLKTFDGTIYSDTSYIQSIARGDGFFDAAYYHYDDKKHKNRVMTLASRLGNPCASLYLGNARYNEGEFDDAVPRYNQVVRYCSCISSQRIDSLWSLAAIAEQQENFDKKFEQLCYVNRNLRLINDHDVHSVQEEGVCQDCNLSLCFCEQCFEGLNDFKESAKQHLYHAFCQATEITDDQVELLYKCCPAEIEEWCQFSVSEEEKRSESYRKKLECLLPYDTHAVIKLAELYDQCNEHEKAAELYQSIADDRERQYPASERYTAFLKCAGAFAANGDIQEMQNALESLLEQLPKKCSNAKRKGKQEINCLCARCQYANEAARLIGDFGKKQSYKKQQELYELGSRFNSQNIALCYRQAKRGSSYSVKFSTDNSKLKQKQQAMAKTFSELSDGASRSNDDKYCDKAKRQLFAYKFLLSGINEQLLSLLENDHSCHGHLLKALGTFSLVSKKRNEILKTKGISLTGDCAEWADRDLALINEEGTDIPGMRNKALSLLHKGLKGEKWSLDALLLIGGEFLRKKKYSTRIKNLGDIKRKFIDQCVQKLGNRDCYSNAIVNDLNECAFGVFGAFLKIIADENIGKKKNKWEKAINETIDLGEQLAERGAKEVYGSLTDLYLKDNAPWHSEEKAKKYCERADQAPQAVESYWGYLMTHKRWKDCLGLLDKVCRNENVKSDFLFKRARLLMQGSGGRHSFDEAYDDFKKLKERENETRYDTWITLCSCTSGKLFLMNTKELVDLEKRLKKNLFRDILEGYVFVARAMLAEYIKTMPQSERPKIKLEDELTLYRNAAPKKEIGLFALLQTAKCNNSEEDKETILTEIVAKGDKYPDHSVVGEALYELGKIEHTRGNIDTAAMHFQKAAQHGCADAYLTMADLPEEERYTKTLELNPSNLMSNYNLGLMYSEEGNDQAALEAYRRAVLRHPYCPELCKNYADLLLSKRASSNEAVQFYGYAERGYMRENKENDVFACTTIKKLCIYLAKIDRSEAIFTNKAEKQEVDSLITLLALIKDDPCIQSFTDQLRAQFDEEVKKQNKKQSNIVKKKKRRR